MGKRKSEPPPSHAELVAEAAAVWGKVAPPPLLKIATAGPVYYTADAWGKVHEMTLITARRHLDALTEATSERPALLTSAIYRIKSKGKYQEFRVYWPVGVSAPG